jgi:hypothetical protein
MLTVTPIPGWLTWKLIHAPENSSLSEKQLNSIRAGGVFGPHDFVPACSIFHHIAPALQRSK